MDFSYAVLTGEVMAIQCISGVFIRGIINRVKGENIDILRATFLYPNGLTVIVPWATVNCSVVEHYYPINDRTVCKLDEEIEGLIYG